VALAVLAKDKNFLQNLIELLVLLFQDKRTRESGGKHYIERLATQNKPIFF